MRTPPPQTTFADVEFRQQGIELDPTLKAISDFLDQHGDIVERVRQDLERGLKNRLTGRRGLTAQQVLRSLILMRVKNWDYRELRERIADGYTLRHFTRFDSQRVPKHDAFNRGINRITPATMEAVNQRIIQAAVGLGLENGKKLRVDTTCVETDVHYPTDDTLLWDTVRVLTRLVHQLDALLPAGVGRFTDRTRSARRRMQEIQRMTPRERHRRQVRTYRRLMTVTENVIAAGREVVTRTARVRGLTPMAGATVDALRAEITRHCELGSRVVSQTTRRVLQNEQVPVDEKVYSIFETHTDLIMRGKVLKPVEFGHKVFLAESGHGLITQYRVLDGNPADQDHVQSSLDDHKALFDVAPDVYASDRGFFNEPNLDACRKAGVTLASIPQKGGQRSAEREAHEKSRAFKRAQRFRAGIEGRISVLFRGRGMKRAPVEGREHFELFVGAAVIASNLLVIGALIQRKAKQREAARQQRRAA
jgi:IS5 family transposase